MKTLIRKLTFLILSVLFTSSVEALPTDSLAEVTEHAIFDLLAISDSAVISADHSQVYLNPERVIVSHKGLFLQSDSGHHIPLSILGSDSRGCYTFLPKLNHSNGVVYPIIRCRKCNLPFSPTIYNNGVCPHCGTQN